MQNTTNNQVLGVVLLIRHGDRQGFYQDPDSYAPFGTKITALGSAQEQQLGGLLRQRYLDPSSPHCIHGIDGNIVNLDQIQARADAGGEGGVIFNSALSLLQGFFPPYSGANDTLANGTTIIAPLGGYQYIPIESVEPENDISLEGWTSCTAFNDATEAFYNSTEFKQKANESADFLNSLKQYLDGRPVSLENMRNIYDFLNVRSIHEANFASQIPPSMLAQARDLANFHEYGVFTSGTPDGIGNIAGQTILPSILNGFARITNTSDPLMILHQEISYKPFISLFKMTAVAEHNPELAGIVDYAAAVALEVRASSNGPVIRFNFKNGTNADDFKVYNLFNASGDVPLSTFVDRFDDVTVNSTAAWCAACHNNVDRGCGEIKLGSAQTVDAEMLHPVGAGLLGAGMAVAFMLIVCFFLFATGCIRWGTRNGVVPKKSSDDVSEFEKV
ncbi:hypothetical protein AGABI2DRAFT_137285 [Agaricus bisporus var. bisporus H97]|uniref:hypothetical protein n=1 Tax=Agaricus bisporus var. bisporus (strain H97 / ATCC MYA-4626 / FGSC 10389) TaxID=936046 RepID=UPI00029F63D2|nr:hypothetical protein AGABI2DRAFT_137285 [Agaricus bisporus var. bisporus H97]EKV45804.1 hypothetical protein AGABI2DRAFT_137285 [Agaricus bisporus var. bisporus H97]